MLTRDRDRAVTVFCIDMYADKWPENPLEFIIPYASEETAAFYRKHIPTAQAYRLTRCDDDIKETLSAVVEACGPEHRGWAFWCTSDRYPWLVDRPALLDEIVAALNGSAVADCDAVKLTRWREDENITTFRDVRTIAGESFEVREAGIYGFWHHHFVRLPQLKRLVEAIPRKANIRRMQKAVSASIKWREALPDKSLIMFHEPLLAGRATLNYELERRALKLQADDREVADTTTTFSSVWSPRANPFWRKHKIDVRELAKRRPYKRDIAVFSFGGVGSKLLVKWLLGPGQKERRYASTHYHWRLPPLRVNEGQRIIYMFGDPRDAIVSFFQRRISRHERHGFDNFSRTKESPALDWPLKALRHIEADTSGFSIEWDLAEYLAQERDYFRLEEHLDFWLGAKRNYDIVFVKYETLWDNFDVLRNLFCLPSRAIPERVARRADWKAEPPEIQTALNRVYGEFAERIASLPSVFLQRHGRLLSLVPSGDLPPPTEGALIGRESGLASILSR
jgi:hypothetical protein